MAFRSTLVAGALVPAMLVLLSLPTQLRAQNVQETLYDVVRISTQASVDVDNDLMVVILVVQEEDKDASSLANKVNATMTWALDSLESFEAIAVRSRNYQTFPTYDSTNKRQLIGWTAKQSIELETDDFAAAGKAIQTLQERLQVQSINLSVKPATRERAADLLIDNALNSFKDRAALVQRNLNSGGFRILELDISTTRGAPTPQHSRVLGVDSYSSRAVESAPAIAAGSSTVQVQVQGRIQLD